MRCSPARAAVADFMVPMAYGTQTGGSIIRPASFCGIVGYKPTYGMIGRGGIKFAAESLDTIGFMARSVRDIEVILAAHAGRPHEPRAVDGDHSAFDRPQERRRLVGMQATAAER